MDTSVEDVLPSDDQSSIDPALIEHVDDQISKNEICGDTEIVDMVPEPAENAIEQEVFDEHPEAKSQVDNCIQLIIDPDVKELANTSCDNENNEVTDKTKSFSERPNPLEQHVDANHDDEHIVSVEKDEIVSTETEPQTGEQQTVLEFEEQEMNQDNVVGEIVINAGLKNNTNVEIITELEHKLCDDVVTEPNTKTIEEFVSECHEDLKKREQSPNDRKSAIIEFDNSTQESGTVVVVATDDDGKEIILQTSDAIHEGTVTVQQVTDESGQIYLLETMDNVIVMEDEDSPETVEIVEMHHPKNLPRHVLGRNIINPSVDAFRNGKAPPKPRLGVKIPYRNLTSQIVSKQEITNEILERSRRMQKDSPKGQNLFAKKLTQTLAKKLAPSKKASNDSSSKSGKGENSKGRKLNNSDLIAILEGDGEPEPEPDTKQIIKPVEVIPMTKELEREIALKQLSELPDDPPENTCDKNKDPKKKAQKSEEAATEKPQRQVDDSNVKKTKKGKSSNETVEDEPPRFSSNVPLKTYTRKRKPSDEATPQDKATVVSPADDEDSTKKIDLPVNPNNYMTKSSRIIKKKIIWDPDEVSPKKMLKSAEGSIIKDKILTNKNDLKEDSEKKIEKERREMIKPEKKVEKVVEVKSEKLTPEKNSLKKIENAKKIETLKKNESPRAESGKMEKKTLVKPKESKTKIELKASNDKLAALKYKKRLTEVDKLLMDEGAVNMLYSFKNTEEDQNKKKTNKSLVSKTNELLNDLQTSTEKVSPKALRKKENVQMSAIKAPRKAVSSPVPSTVSRQKSRDSNRSSVHSPPASPATVCSADASRIIRRHSSSSFSSMDDDDDFEDDDEVDEDEDYEDDEEIDVPKSKKTESKAGRRKAETVAENPRKKVKREVSEKTSKEKSNAEMSKTFNKLVDVKPVKIAKYNKYKTLTVVKIEQLIEIILSPNQEDEVYINIEVMQDLIAILKDLETDSDCNAVVLTSSANSFTSGIDFKVLLAHKEVTKKGLAKKLATNVRDFLLALANFPKVLVAAVHGEVIGLGVTMLPLFDMIIATESTSFETPYAQLGCIAEGGSLMSLTQSQNILVSELLYNSQVLKAPEALKLGLITRIMADDNFQINLRMSLRDMYSQSAQFLEATKKQLRQRLIPDITAALNSEMEALVQQWISPECQRNFTEIYNV